MVFNYSLTTLDADEFTPKKEIEYESRSIAQRRASIADEFAKKPESRSSISRQSTDMSAFRRAPTMVC
jgi:hypothetical protein